MEPEDLFLLEQGPASFSLTIMMPIKSESEPPPETLVFKKWREQFHVVYVSDKLWTSDKMLLEEKEKSGFLQPVLTTLGIESLKNVASSCCYVLQRDSESGWWIMWLAVMSSKSEKVELTLLFPQSKTKAAFWTEGMHSYVLSDWDLCLGDSDSTYDSWARHANIITELDNVKKTEWVSSDAHRLSVDQQQ